MTDKYDWTAYYRSAFEKEKKETMALAAQVADAQAKESDLCFRLERILNNPFWKASVPIRKCCHMLLPGRGGEEGEKAVCGAAGSAVEEGGLMSGPEAVSAYQREVFRQKHPYLQWIAAQEQESRQRGTAGSAGEQRPGKTAEGKEWPEEAENAASGVRQMISEPIRGGFITEVEGADLCILAYGYGLPDEEAARKAAEWFREHENCLFAYADEDYYWKEISNRMHPWFKPCWSPDTMLSFCYMGHMIFVRRSLGGEILAGYRDGIGSYADFYDLCLRLEEKAQAGHYAVSHLEEVLFHNCYEPDAAGEEQIKEAKGQGKDVLETVEKLLLGELERGRDMTGCDIAYHEVRKDALRRRGIRARLRTGEVPDIYHVVYEAPETEEKQALVSVIIPSKDHPETLEKCLYSFRERTAYKHYEWIVVDNGSSPENKSRVEALQKEYGFRYLYEPMEFNFSAMCNLGASGAQGEYLLFLNDDIEIIQKDWLTVMLGQAGRPHTGAVGAKLWYADSRKIQHAGITNLAIGPSHKLVTFMDDRCYYYGRNQVTYDVIGVTAACLMIARKKYQEVGGMEESMKVSYNDVDLCFKLIEAGYYNVLRNDAVLYHAESLSRGLDEEDGGKWERLLREKENLYARHPGMQDWDGFYHKNLIDNASRYACNFKYEYENNLKTTEAVKKNAGNPAEAENGILQLTVDRAEEQHKIHREEPDILFLMGWSYLPGKDNAGYARYVVLERDDGTLYEAIPNPWCRPDVEAVLTGEVNISLAGFTLRIRKENLQSGVWRVGMRAVDLNSGQQFLTWSDRKMIVK